MNKAFQKQFVTSGDVAKLAKVSQSAVSRTFTSGASVSIRTREKVLKAAADLSYRPNALAQAMTSRASSAQLESELDSHMWTAPFGRWFFE